VQKAPGRRTPAQEEKKKSGIELNTICCSDGSCREDEDGVGGGGESLLDGRKRHVGRLKGCYEFRKCPMVVPGEVKLTRNIRTSFKILGEKS